MPGNVAKLMDDCWAFGSSIAQEALLKEADSALKAPDRRSPASLPKSSSSTQTPSQEETDKMEAIVINMVRLDREMQQFRASNEKLNATLAAQRVRITNLEELAAGPARPDSQDISGTAPVTSAAPSPADGSAAEHATMAMT